MLPEGGMESTHVFVRGLCLPYPVGKAKVV